jgi:predicted Zn-dependent protease
MAHSHSTLRSALLIGVLAAAQSAWSAAAEPARVVFPNGKSIPLASLTLQGDKLVVQTEADGFKTGQTFPLQSADHVYGEKPAAVNQAIALLLTGKPKEAQKLLEPVVAEHRITAKIPGNFWLEPARALLVAHAANGDAKECTELGKEISEATPAQGTDPFVTLGKALLLPATVKLAEREAALRDLTTDNFPTDVSAYAAYFRGNLFKKEKRNAEALEAYLAVPCLFPSGGLVLTAAAEVQVAEFLTAQGRPAEATALLNSAIRDAAGTLLVEEAKKRLESLK